ncbi:hypothetical protein ACIQU4_40940 [Streptomyces sp. NPDC090741]|uniref:hypothetical protein n=1 Tax=Streptomyces sp. NPDC090741 TaxID=3365967 RepID=UPI00381E6A2E
MLRNLGRAGSIGAVAVLAIMTSSAVASADSTPNAAAVSAAPSGASDQIDLFHFALIQEKLLYNLKRTIFG